MEHATSARTYAKVLATLVAFTIVTVLAAGVEFGSPSVNAVIALVVASVKASLVALFFMHLRHEKPMNAVIFVCGLVCLGIFLMFCFLDTDSRDVVRPANARPAPAAALGKLAARSTRP